MKKYFLIIIFFSLIFTCCEYETIGNIKVKEENWGNQYEWEILLDGYFIEYILFIPHSTSITPNTLVKRYRKYGTHQQIEKTEEIPNIKLGKIIRSNNRVISIEVEGKTYKAKN